MRVLDLFHGTGSATEAFVRLGHEVVGVDLNPATHATIHGSLADRSLWDAILTRGPYDFVWASPPCERFSVAALGRNWNPDGTAKNEDARMAELLVQSALDLIQLTGARWWIMENPRGMLRTRPVVAHLERRTVTYCRLGDTRMKPTDLWGVFPPSLRLPAPCQNGMPCHEAAPRGSRTGTQGVEGYLNRSRVPYALGLLVAIAVERELDVALPADDGLDLFAAVDNSDAGEVGAS